MTNLMTPGQTLYDKLCDKLGGWFMDFYECVTVSTAAYPDQHYSIDIQWSDDCLLYTNRADRWSLMDKWLYTTVDDARFSIWLQMFAKGFNYGSLVFVRQYPMMFADITLYKQRRIGYYGWLEVFVPWRQKND